MKIKNIISGLVFALVLLSLPSSTFAHKTTGQSAIKINDNAALFLIDFEFGFLNADTWLPSRAVNQTDGSDSQSLVPVLDYVINSGYESGDLTSTAVILSQAEITNGDNYYVPRGDREKFTLVVLVQKNPGIKRAPQPTSVSMTNLAHILKTDRRTILTLFDKNLLNEHVTKPLVW